MSAARLRVSLWGLVAAAGLFAPAAQASSVTYYLNQSDEDVLFPDGTNYATVKIEDVGSDIVFTVSVVPGAFSAGTNFGFQTFGFNVAPDAPSLLGGTFVLPTGWSATAGSNQDGFGNFDWALSGTGSTRQSPLSFSIQGVTGDTLASYFDLSSGTAGQGNQYFAAHIAGFNALPGTDVTSAFVGGGGSSTVVPLPATAWLLLSGVAALGALARRRRSLAA